MRTLQIAFFLITSLVLGCNAGSAEAEKSLTEDLKEDPNGWNFMVWADLAGDVEFCKNATRYECEGGVLIRLDSAHLVYYFSNEEAKKHGKWLTEHNRDLQDLEDALSESNPYREVDIEFFTEYMTGIIIKRGKMLKRVAQN